MINLYIKYIFEGLSQFEKILEKTQTNSEFAVGEKTTLADLKRDELLNLTDTGEDSKLVHRRKRPKVDKLFSSLFFRRFRATSMTQCRVENTHVHFWTFSPVSVKKIFQSI